MGKIKTFVKGWCVSDSDLFQPMKFITTRCKTVWANRKSAKALSGEMDKKSPLFWGLIWIRRHTGEKKTKKMWTKNIPRNADSFSLHYTKCRQFYFKKLFFGGGFYWFITNWHILQIFLWTVQTYFTCKKKKKKWKEKCKLRK